MKKIITAAAIAAMVTSFAAADVKVGLNARVRPDLYKVVGTTKEDTTEKGKVDAHTTTTYADLDGFATAKDTLTIKGNTDYAGVVAELTVNSPYASSQDGSVTIDNYYAWLNWGALKFTAGAYDSRYTNRGNYTATEQGILDEEFSKTMGTSSKNGLSKSVFGKKTYINTLNYLSDFGNVAQVAGANSLSFLADYTLNDIGGGTLLLKGGLVESGAKSAVTYDSYTDDDKNSFTQADGYVFEAAWRKDGLLAADFIFKNPVNKAYGVGLYITPLMVPNTKNVVVGFTYGWYDDPKAKKTSDNSLSAFAIDLRGQYNINSAATVAIGAKYESATVDKKVVLNKTKTPNGVDNGSAFQVAGEFSYKVNDLLTAALDLGYFNEDLTDADDNEDDGTQFFVTSLRAKWTAGKNAAITTALRLNKVLNPADGGTDYTFDIPVVLRVKM